MDEDEDVLAEIARAIAKKRGYADFFDWPDKRQKELGLLQTLAEALANIPHLRLSDERLTAPDEDPPDALAHCTADGDIAIELTELVDERLIKRRQKSKQAQWRPWRREEFRSTLEEVVRRKDAASIRTPGAPTNYWIVVHTDEPALTADQVASYVTDYVVGPCRLITRCFVLLSYDPWRKGYPVFEVSVRRAA